MTESELNEIQLRTNLQYRGQPDADKLLESLKASYTLDPSSGNYLQHSQEYADTPAIGADCDTFQGNSGSPVYHKSRHMVIGLIFAGEEDRPEPWQAGWQRHEMVLPIKPVLDVIKQSVRNWSTLGLQISE